MVVIHKDDLKVQQFNTCSLKNLMLRCNWKAKGFAEAASSLHGPSLAEAASVSLAQSCFFSPVYVVEAPSSSPIPFKLLGHRLSLATV